MTLEIRIDMDNAAFEGDYWDSEVRRILSAAKLHHLTDPGDDLPLIDLNGNRVGTAKLL